jgi:hypothetical protein
MIHFTKCNQDVVDNFPIQPLASIDLRACFHCLERRTRYLSVRYIIYTKYRDHSAAGLSHVDRSAMSATVKSLKCLSFFGQLLPSK